MSENKKRFPAACILLAVLILIQLVYSTYMFVYKKNGTHSDEIWSYGLANSYYRPFIYLPDGIYQDEYNGGYEGSDITNKWIDGKVMNDYVTVQENERFTYDSVYHNQVLDHHPPLYYGILHTICSFFPNSFSLWYAFSINLVSMVFIQIFLFKLTKLYTDEDTLALTVCLLYGAGTGALSTVLFLRQYCFMTMLITMYYYFSAKLFKSFDKEKGFDLKKYAPPMAVTAFLLFFTNYTMAIICGIFTAVVCLYMLTRKKVKQMFIYGLSMTAALGAFCAAYPYVIKHVFLYKNMGNGKEYEGTYRTRLIHVLDLLFKHTVGKEFSIYKSATIYYVIAVLAVLTVICVPLCFLFRKEVWFRKFAGGTAAWIKGLPKKIPADIKTIDGTFIAFLVANIAFVLMLPVISDIKEMGQAGVRYLFVVMPLVCLTVVGVVYAVLRDIPKRVGEITVLIMAVVLICVININEQAPFLYKHTSGYTDLAEDSAGSNVLLLASDGSGDVWYAQCFPAYLRKADGIFITNVKDDESFEKNTDGRNIDMVIAPVDSFRKDGEWYKKIIDNDSDFFEEMTDKWKTGAASAFENENNDAMQFCDDRLEGIAAPDKSEVLYSINVQNYYYAVIQLNS
ncbi:MAG: glycosyltransferase family 39 protein [Ruminococcus sp.]|uniref:hypothetical protein n=1 Tax=Ruminococcus sp. TaxID=41978 RepID=UPI0025DD90D6|nr:hypothetical protein [Ruminococcus sp.]MCR5540559.1 glycosyltransferase family 39 protein [Ruminococcus sp.]